MFQSYEKDFFHLERCYMNYPKYFNLLFLKINFITLHYQNKPTCHLDKNKQK